jgi:hypothetical protein
VSDDVPDTSDDTLKPLIVDVPQMVMDQLRIHASNTQAMSYQELVALQERIHMEIPTKVDISVTKEGLDLSGGS